MHVIRGLLCGGIKKRRGRSWMAVSDRFSRDYVRSYGFSLVVGRVNGGALIVDACTLSLFHGLARARIRGDGRG
ncbi:unnamed protein product [Onchocerca flexuosa]|uniref:Transposase n=1 Tax=Onchocerca flexuosa TaxID=387005 RepID=A0A183HFE1_9BILA|nr:unnamed protein product [Onchocerca flexuosa]